MTTSPSQAFVDESIQRRTYSMVAVLVPSDRVAEMRKRTRSLLLPGQSRLHMSKESLGRQRHLVGEVASFGVEAIVASRPLGRLSDRQLRDACLADLVATALQKGVVRLSIESCDQDRQDRQLVAQSLGASRAGFADGYHHYRGAHDPLLWLPDIVAWAYGKGGRWAATVASAVTPARKLVA